MSPLLLVHVPFMAAATKKFLLLVALALLATGMVSLFIGQNQYRRIAALGSIALGSISSLMFFILSVLGTTKRLSEVLGVIGIVLMIAGVWRFERSGAAGTDAGSCGSVRKKRGLRRSHHEKLGENTPEHRP